VYLSWFLFFVGLSLFGVLFYRFVNPPFTWLMIERGFQRKAAGKDWKIDKHWKDFDDISDNMKRAAVAAEDQPFWSITVLISRLLKKLSKKIA
jgi:monofunctional biosynthetic peptidoglycan transglycosylase